MAKFKYNRQKFPQVATDCEVDYKKGLQSLFLLLKISVFRKISVFYPIVTTQESTSGIGAWRGESVVMRATQQREKH